MSSAKSLLVATLIASTVALAHSDELPAAGRGKLLYNTHCISCHTTQIHWRDDRRAQSWDGLKLQVRRWQDNTNMQWTESDIAAVAQHLNETIYHFEQTTDRVGQTSQRAAP